MKSMCTLLLFIISVSVYSQSASDTIEPKPRFLLKINGKEYNITEGQEIKFDSVFRQPTISVKQREYKRFENNFIAFDYPNSFAYQFEESEGLRHWTLDGSNCVIMLFEMSGAVTADNLATEMIDKFGKKNCSLEVIQKQFGSKTLKGKRIHVNIANTKLNVDIYAIQSGGLLSKFILFQDSINDDGSPSNETGATLKLFNQSVNYK